MLRRGQEFAGHHRAPVLLAEPDQQLEMLAGRGLRVQRLDALEFQKEAVRGDGLVDSRHPAQVTDVLHDLSVSLVVDMNAIAAGLLCELTSCMRGCERRLVVEPRLLQRQHADADAEREASFLPGEARGANLREQALGRLARLGGRAVFHQDSKFIATRPREDIVAAKNSLQLGGHVAQQLIPGQMPAGVVDDLEAVQVEITQTMAATLVLGLFQAGFQAPFELTAIQQAGDRVVGRLVV